LDDLDILSIKVDGIENGNKDSSLTFKAQNKLVNLEEEFKRLTDNLDPNIHDSLPLIMLQKQIDDHQRNLLPKFQQILALPLADKMKAIKSLLSEAEEFNQEINSLRNKFETLEAVLNQLDKTDLDSIRIVTDEELNIYETMVDSILNKNFNKTIDEYEDVIQLFEETNKTVNEYAANYAQQMNKIDEIKEQNLYVQKSLADLKALILKAKNVENFSDKDVTFKAYFDNLEQIKNETNHLQQMSTQTLNKIEQIVKDAYETLAVIKFLFVFDSLKSLIYFLFIVC
jgi:DNA repair exonuclease SbcCD ATPase subunit